MVAGCLDLLEFDGDCGLVDFGLIGVGVWGTAAGFSGLVVGFGVALVFCLWWLGFSWWF